MIVHCSAGIGRTGVLILMDTALALMESREAVYPLDIVRTMRDQRACMVQNVVGAQTYGPRFLFKKGATSQCIETNFLQIFLR